MHDTNIFGTIFNRAGTQRHMPCEMNVTRWNGSTSADADCVNAISDSFSQRNREGQRLGCGQEYHAGLVRASDEHKATHAFVFQSRSVDTRMR